MVRTNDKEPKLVPLKPKDSNTSEIRFASWAPINNAIAYIDYDNNIYYRPTVGADDIKVTSSGEVDQVFNGIPDWVFEEEVFEDNSALWWAPDGQSIVFGHFSDLLGTVGTI